MSSQILPRMDMESIKTNRKLSHLRAIGNQIRYGFDLYFPRENSYLLMISNVHCVDFCVA